MILLATSMDAEHAFSRGGLTVSRLRHSLNDTSVRASALLASWSSIPTIVPETETIALLKSHIRKHGGHDDGHDCAGGRAGAEQALRASSRASGSSHVGRQSRPSTPSSTPVAGSSQAACSVPGPSVVKPKAISRSSSAASITSDARRKDQASTRALLAASGSKKRERRAAPKRNDDDLEVIVVSSESEAE